MVEPMQSASGPGSGGAFQQFSPGGVGEDVAYLGPEITNYFQAVPRLNELRSLANQAVGPSAYDLVIMLNREALKAGFEPVGAYNQGITTDAFFQTNIEFQTMEDQLARKIGPENVSEVFELIKEADHYKPSGKVLGVIEHTYLRLIALKEAGL
jgi:hypothetical protein